MLFLKQLNKRNVQVNIFIDKIVPAFVNSLLRLINKYHKSNNIENAINVALTRVLKSHQLKTLSRVSGVKTL